MRHFIAYHSVELMGYDLPIEDDFHFISRKAKKHLEKTYVESGGHLGIGGTPYLFIDMMRSDLNY